MISHVSLFGRRVTIDNSFWIRLLGVVIALALSAILAYEFRFRQLILTMAVLFAAGMAIPFLRWPALGVGILFVINLYVPVAFQAPGSNSVINSSLMFVAFLTGLWLLDVSIDRVSIRELITRPMVALLALVAVTIIAFLAGQLPWFGFIPHAPLSAQIGSIGLIALSVAAFMIAATRIRNRVWLQRVVWVFLVASGIYIGGRVIPGGNQIVSKLVLLGAAGSGFWLWVVAIAFGQVAFNESLTTRRRALLAGLILATFYLNLIRNPTWASGWVPCAAAVSFIIWARFPRLRLPLILAFLAIIVTLFRPLLGLLLTAEQYSWNTRLAAWEIVLSIAQVNPIFGLGPANYYFFTPLYNILGWNVQFNSHNQYVDLIAQVGFVGLGLYLWFSAEMMMIAWKLRKTGLKPFDRAYAYGILGGLAGMLVSGMLGDWVLPFIYNVGLAGFRSSVLFWVFLGGMAALKRYNEVESAQAGEVALEE